MKKAIIILIILAIAVAIFTGDVYMKDNEKEKAVNKTYATLNQLASVQGRTIDASVRGELYKLTTPELYELDVLKLENNNISDIIPLVNNRGISGGNDYIKDAVNKGAKVIVLGDDNNETEFNEDICVAISFKMDSSFTALLSLAFSSLSTSGILSLYIVNVNAYQVKTL